MPKNKASFQKYLNNQPEYKNLSNTIDALESAIHEKKPRSEKIAHTLADIARATNSGTLLLGAAGLLFGKQIFATNKDQESSIRILKNELEIARKKLKKFEEDAYLSYFQSLRPKSDLGSSPGSAVNESAPSDNTAHKLSLKPNQADGFRKRPEVSVEIKRKARKFSAEDDYLAAARARINALQQDGGDDAVFRKYENDLTIALAASPNRAKGTQINPEALNIRRKLVAILKESPERVFEEDSSHRESLKLIATRLEANPTDTNLRHARSILLVGLALSPQAKRVARATIAHDARPSEREQDQYLDDEQNHNSHGAICLEGADIDQSASDEELLDFYKNKLSTALTELEANFTGVKSLGAEEASRNAHVCAILTKKIESAKRSIKKVEEKISARKRVDSLGIETLCIDGSNLCNETEPQRYVGLSILDALVPTVSKKYKTVLIFDESTMGKLGETEASLRARYPDCTVIVSQENYAADPLLIGTANSSTGTFILSNDGFADYRDDPAVRENRVVRFKAFANTLHIEQLHLSVSYADK